MALQLNEEQQLLKAAVDRYIERDYSFETRRALLASNEPFGRDHWQRYAELGWLGAGLAEDLGGFGGGAVEQAVVAEGLGRGMALEPFVSSACMGAEALSIANDTENLAKLIAGELLVSVAFAETRGRYDLHHVETTARADGAHYRLNGTKVAVFDATAAHMVIVAARIAGEPRDPSGIGLFVVSADNPAVKLEGYRTMDGTMAANLTFADCEADLLVGPEGGSDALNQCVERAIIARCASAVGAMDTAYAATLEYVKTSEQFGVKIGTFQVLQHRLVEIGRAHV